MGGADKKMPPVARLEQQEKMLTLQLEALKRSRAALEGIECSIERRTEEATRSADLSDPRSVAMGKARYTREVGCGAGCCSRVRNRT